MYPPKILYTETQRHEAAEWFLVIHDRADPTPESLHAWLRWVDLNEGNRAAFEAVARAWHATTASTTEAMPTADELAADKYEADQPVDQWLAQGTKANAVVGMSRSSFMTRRTWLTAASFGALAVGLTTMFRYPNIFVAQSEIFETKVGEQLQITLGDGSRVWLAPKSLLTVSFTRQLRSLQLSAGEAFFTVRKDRIRPFTVRSVSGNITAIGTAFNVRAIDGRVTVAVSEGVVTVAPITAVVKTEPGIRVATGEQLSFMVGEPIHALTVTQTPTVGERARWREGVLVYRDEPLRDVVMDIVRYSGKQIEIPDAAVGDLRFSGVIYKTAVDEWTDALPESFPVKVDSEGDRKFIRAR